MKLFITLVLTLAGLPISAQSITSTADIRDSLFSIGTLNSSGNAFLLQEQTNVWLVSNSYVFGKDDRYNIQNSNRVFLEMPETIQVATDRDLIRFKTSLPAGLTIAKAFDFGEKVHAYNTKSTAGSSWRTGTIAAIGPDRIEITAEIFPDSPGNPIFNKNDEVIAVTSYCVDPNQLSDWTTRETRFEKKRRMALTLNQVEWIEMPLSDYNNQVEWVKKVENGIDVFTEIITLLATNQTEKINKVYDNRKVERWRQQHNQLVDDLLDARGGYTTYTAISLRDSFSRRFESDFKALGSAIRGFEKDAGNRNKVTLPYFQEQLRQTENFYRQMREQLKAFFEQL